MAGAKLVVIYPRPKDIVSFEHVYLNEHVPMAVATVPSRCRDPFFDNGGSASVHRIGRRQTDDRQCGGDFFRRRTDFPGRRRGSICVLANQSRLTVLVMITPSAQRALIIHSLVGNISLRPQF
jgi:hypothetical protein